MSWKEGTEMGMENKAREVIWSIKKKVYYRTNPSSPRFG